MGFFGFGFNYEPDQENVSKPWFDFDDGDGTPSYDGEFVDDDDDNNGGFFGWLFGSDDDD